MDFQIKTNCSEWIDSYLLQCGIITLYSFHNLTIGLSGSQLKSVLRIQMCANNLVGLFCHGLGADDRFSIRWNFHSKHCDIFIKITDRIFNQNQVIRTVDVMPKGEENVYKVFIPKKKRFVQGCTVAIREERRRMRTIYLICRLLPSLSLSL